MSYFYVYVLIPGSKKDVGQRVHQLMAPHHSEFEVEEYETECDCTYNRDPFDPDCEQCCGTGSYFST